MKRLAGAAIAFAALFGPAHAAVTTTVVDLPVAGHTQRFLYVEPDAPLAHIVVLSGGDGVLAIQADGTMGTVVAQCGPITRNRQAWAEAGFALSFLDIASNGVPPDLAEVMEVLEYVRARHDVPIWMSGGSASTFRVAGVAANLPSTYPVGLLLGAPQRLGASAGAAIRRPTIVASHSADPAAFGSATFNALTSAPVKERLTFSGGTNAGCGYHLFQGLDAEYLARTSAAIVALNRATEPSFQALWYAAPAESEPGWGVNIAHQGDVLFATWFTYDAAGPMWLAMSEGRRLSRNVYRGALYRTTGPAFDASPFDSSSVVATPVGEATFTFTDDGEADFAYTVNGASGSKRITRQVYSATPSHCWAGDAASGTNFQDLWWNPAESGWGVNITHQGDTLFATWFTYGAGGKGRWLVMSNLQRAAGTQRYAGDIYRTTGPRFDAYDRSQLAVAAAGTATFEFTGASAGTFAYTLDGVSQSKPITRQAFGPPATVCR